MKGKKKILLVAAILVAAALAAFLIKTWTERGGEETLEQEGLSSILDKVRETEEFPENCNIAYLEGVKFSVSMGKILL